MGGATYLFFGPADHHGKLAIIVGLALITNIFTAAVGGILAPLALAKMGRDPAVSVDLRDLPDRLHRLFRGAADRGAVVALSHSASFEALRWRAPQDEAFSNSAPHPEVRAEGEPRRTQGATSGPANR
jgi:hypothetical protein